MIARLLAALTASIALTGCGGGGGGSTAGSGDLPNSLIASDIFVFSPQFGDERIQTNCRGDRCSVMLDGETETITVKDLIAVPPARAALARLKTRGGLELSVWQATQDDPQFGRLDAESYGGWLEFASFGTGYGIVRSGELRGTSLFVSAVAGTTPNTNPVSGSATWSGAMVGNVVGPDIFVDGDATVAIDFRTALLGVDFDGIADIRSGRSYPSMSWAGLRTSRGSFFGVGIRGQFYGPNHEEVAGVFERGQIIGAFGAKR